MKVEKLILIFFLFSFYLWAENAQLPSNGTYSLQSSDTLELKNVTEKSFDFNLVSINEYNGDICELDGQSHFIEKNKWYYESKKCRVTFDYNENNSFAVQVNNSCRSFCGMSASFVSGSYLKQNKGECKKISHIANLSKEKKFQEALNLAKKIEKECLAGMDENAIGSLYSDMAFLSFKTNNKKACLEYVANGINKMPGAEEGLDKLKESLAFYATDGINNCQGATNPGCETYQERIKIYGWLKHNETTCQ